MPIAPHPFWSFRMEPRTCVALLVALVTATAQAAAQSGASPTSPALIARGDSVYHGAGNCYACHGGKAEGLVGPNLTDAEWLHSKGTYEEIVAQIQEGVTKEKSKSGIPMPAKGGGSISDEDIKAVAAYVLSLGQKPGS